MALLEARFRKLPQNSVIHAEIGEESFQAFEHVKEQNSLNYRPFDNTPNEERERQLRAHVCSLLKRYKTVHVTFNEKPEGSIIQLIFRKTEKDKTVNW